ncbi:MAG TPA: VOC family protein [Stellaceae bacterium]|nr:VOC family protein [Stellaceae bacterium]
MSRSGITGIDHILLAVRDLDAARMGWTRLGFTLSPRGKHLGRGTGNYCVMFPHDYIELFGIVGSERVNPEYTEFLAAGEGPMKLAWATGDSAAAVAALSALRLHPDVPRDLGRQLELPEGTVVPRFSIVALPREETPALSSFLCAQLTPELMRRPEWLEHANGSNGLLGITAVVDETAPLQEAYERLFGPASVHTTDDILTLRIGRHHVLFASAEDFAAMHPEIDLARRAAPFIALLTLLVSDPEKTVDYLTTWQIPHEVLPDRRVLVPAEEANGAVLEFVSPR